MAIISKKDFKDYISKNILILDGASGTQLQKLGLPTGVCPEKWALDNKDKLIAMQKEYIAAGSKAIYSFTFGGNGVKLATYGLHDVYGLNKRLAEISRQVAGDSVFVGGSVGSTGLLFEPLGDLTFERAYDIFAEQIRGLNDGGSDFIIIETMIDLNEARTALLVAKELTDLPVAVSMTFDEHGRTLTGSTPIETASALQAAGADIIGVNCSTGPDKMVKVVSKMQSVAEVPIIAKPNAGVPQIVDGNTVFSLCSDDFKNYALPLIQAGASLFGGCCGTTPEYIEAILSVIKSQKPVPNVEHSRHYISCINNTLFMGETPIVISKTVNPENLELYSAIQQEDYDAVLDAALNDADEGALAMNISAYNLANEGEVLVKMAETITLRTHMPVCFRSKNDSVIEYALKRYPGRALVYPKSYARAEFLELLKVLKKYDALAVFSPHSYDDDDDLRLQLKHKVMDIIFMTERAEEIDFPKESLIINVTSGKDTQPFVKWCSDNNYKTAVDSSKLDPASFDLAVKKGATIIFADIRDTEMMKIVNRHK